MIRRKEYIYRIFYGIFAVLYGYICLKVLFGDSIHEYKTWELLLIMLVAIAVIVAVFFALRRLSEVIEKHYRCVLIVFSVFYGIAILSFGFLLRFTPAFDMDAIYGGAIQWLQTGSFTDYYEYMGSFPNNLGGMTFLYIFFSIASVFGVTDFFAVGIVVNSLMLVAMAVFLSLICKKLGNAVSGVMALVVLLLCLPFYFMGAAFYTDSLSVLFPVLFYYLYLQFKNEEEMKKRIILVAGMGVVLALGMMIKFTVLIILVAVILDALLTLPWKRVLFLTGSSIIIVVICFNLFHAYIYHAHLDREQCRQLETPYLHWIMMGMQGNGNYNPEDYEFTRSIMPEERNKKCMERIGERLSDMGLGGLIELFERKALVCFGDGTFAVSDFLDDTPVKESAIHKFILYGGEKYDGYKHLATGILLAIYFIMIYGAGKDAFCKGWGKWQESCLVSRLAGLGILAFLLLWETSGRYFTNFVPMLIICAVLAVRDWHPSKNAVKEAEKLLGEMKEGEAFAENKEV